MVAVEAADDKGHQDMFWCTEHECVAHFPSWLAKQAALIRWSSDCKSSLYVCVLDSLVRQAEALVSKVLHLGHLSSPHGVGSARRSCSTHLASVYIHNILFAYLMHWILFLALVWCPLRCHQLAMPLFLHGSPFHIVELTFNSLMFPNPNTTISIFLS